MTGNDAVVTALVAATTVAALGRTISETLVGRSARIVSKFNGQPHGRSRPPLTGKVFPIVAAFAESDGDITVWLGAQVRVYSLKLGEVEVL